MGASMDEVRRIVSGRITEGQVATSWKLLSKLAKEYARDATGVFEVVEKKDTVTMIRSIIWSLRSLTDLVEEFFEVSNPDDVVRALRNAQEALERYENQFIKGASSTSIR